MPRGVEGSSRIVRGSYLICNCQIEHWDYFFQYRFVVVRPSLRLVLWVLDIAVGCATKGLHFFPGYCKQVSRWLRLWSNPFDFHSPLQLKVNLPVDWGRVGYSSRLPLGSVR